MPLPVLDGDQARPPIATEGGDRSGGQPVPVALDAEPGAEVRAWVEGRADAGPRAPSAQELQKLLGLQDNIRAWLPTATPLSVAEVLQLTSRQQGNPGELNNALVSLAQTALDALTSAREREGKRLSAMLLDRLTRLRELPVRTVHGGHFASFSGQRMRELIDAWFDAHRLN